MNFSAVNRLKNRCDHILLRVLTVQKHFNSLFPQHLIAKTHNSVLVIVYYQRLCLAPKKEAYSELANPLLVERYVLEQAKRAQNKHMCDLFDAGRYCGHEYIVMTLVGRSLRDIVKDTKKKRFSAGCVISVGLQCLEAIEELHRIGFIHRDIKPSNFTTGRSSLIHGVRRIYLIDFGFSFQYVDSNDRVKRLHVCLF
ncbi:unnamed protein product [Gongylonema pulchrum]|uniref:non-specific serine/threonine protein kinase n=1 Tax=Gongylonema pulchrum TaxID=637853 RepID=A0A183EPV2_9BILA|nr:unnamed protein product [Gongylonema pulchrum]